MTDFIVTFQIISVFLLISFAAVKLIINPARTGTAKYYALDYLIIIILYIKTIAALNDFWGRKWLNRKDKQGLIFLASIYTACLALSFVTLFIAFYLQKGRAKNTQP